MQPTARPTPTPAPTPTGPGQAAQLAEPKGKAKPRGEVRIPPKSIGAIIAIVGIVMVGLVAEKGREFGRTVSLGLGPEWTYALQWVENNTEPDEVVASWWDYGYWIETYARRRSIADGATKDDGPIRDMARAFLLDEAEMDKFCEAYNVSIVMVDVAQDILQGKWGAMAYIAMVDSNDYVQSGANQTMVIKEAGQRAPIFRMASVVILQQPLPMQNLVFEKASPTGQVVIYAYTPHWSRSQVIGENLAAPAGVIGLLAVALARWRRMVARW